MRWNGVIYQVETWEKSVQNMPLRLPLKLHIFNGANLGEHFGLQIKNHIKIASKLGWDIYSKMKFCTQPCYHFLNRLYLIFQLDKCNHSAILGQFTIFFLCETELMHNEFLCVCAFESPKEASTWSNSGEFVQFFRRNYLKNTIYENYVNYV